ncbi:MAG: transposase, partial [Oligoflexales bacterium]
MLKLLSESSSQEQGLLFLSLDEIARSGARQLLSKALELEVEEYITRHNDSKDSDGNRFVVRNGKGKARKITTGAGTIDVQAPRINDKREGSKFTSHILPPYLRKSRNVESILPLLYLKGLSGNAFQESLCGLLGSDVGGLSSSSISALKKSWRADMEQWRSRAIEDDFVYVWADG